MAFDTQTPQEISDRLGKREGALELYRQAHSHEMNLSRYLEMINPSQKGDDLDAFGRQLQAAGIIIHSDPQAGYWSSNAGVFVDTDRGRALFPEFFARTWRSVAYATPAQRAAIYLSNQAILGSVERPYTDNTAAQWNNQFAPAIPLSEIVAVTTGITGIDYRSVYMTYDAEALRLYRVGESAEIPMATLSTAQRAVTLKKYGRGIRATYEQLRRSTIDKISWWIRWMALQAEIDKVSAALDILVNGDGNANTSATEYNLLTLDTSATANELTLAGWLAFRMKWETPYQMTTALGRVEEILQLILLNSGSANVPLAGLNLAGIGNTLTPINTTADGIRYGWTSEAPDGKIVGFDKRFALEQLTEIGGNITETERYITNQTEVMVMTEVNGFAILDPAATKILDFTE